MNTGTIEVRTGTLGGICTVIIANIASSDVLKTAILAAIGAVVSCSVSLLVKWLTDKFRKRKEPE